MAPSTFPILIRSSHSPYYRRVLRKVRTNGEGIPGSPSYACRRPPETNVRDARWNSSCALMVFLTSFVVNAQARLWPSATAERGGIRLTVFDGVQQVNYFGEAHDRFLLASEWRAHSSSESRGSVISTAKWGWIVHWKGSARCCHVDVWDGIPVALVHPAG